MSPDSEDRPRVVDIEDWVDRVRQNPTQYRERQATEILLSAVGMSPSYRERLYLKGGTLMGIVYNSPRQTADIDFTANFEPSEEVIADLQNDLNRHLALAATRIGYLDILCRVQSIRRQPRDFDQASFPALKVKIGYAERGSAQARRLRDGDGSANVLKIDVSFREPVAAIQIVRLGKEGPALHAYGLVDLVAEKFRALLQQTYRNRERRQDVYDLARLIQTFSLDAEERAQVLAALREKASSRGIEPRPDHFEDPRIAEMAQSQWQTMALEIEDLPDFNSCYAVVRAFYRHLPWDV